MGVDWFDCDVCGKSICDAGDYVSCECGRNWCDEECASEDGYERYDWDDESIEVPIINGYEVESSCKYCREEDFEDDILLEFAIKELGQNGLTREKLIQMYKDSK